MSERRNTAKGQASQTPQGHADSPPKSDQSNYTVHISMLQHSLVTDVTDLSSFDLDAGFLPELEDSALISALEEPSAPQDPSLAVERQSSESVFTEQMPADMGLPNLLTILDKDEISCGSEISRLHGAWQTEESATTTQFGRGTPQTVSYCRFVCKSSQL